MKRKVYLDLLRILAVYLVIFTHTGDIGSKLYVYGSYNTWRNCIYVLVDVARCVNVPLFFMISGVVLLRKEETYRHIFSKRIMKYFIILSLTAYLYSVFYYAKPWNDFPGFIKELLNGTVVGHLWFLYAYIGYLLILPYMRKMIKQMENKDYVVLLLLGILFKGVLSVIGALSGLGKIYISCALVTDIIFYPMMGTWLSKQDIGELLKKKLFFAAGFVVCMLCFVAEAYMTKWDMQQNGAFTENFLSVFNVLPTLYIFLLGKEIGNKIEKNKKVSSFVCLIGGGTFGVYLISIWLQTRLIFVYEFFYSLLPDLPLISSYLYVAVVFVLGTVLALMYQCLIKAIKACKAKIKS